MNKLHIALVSSLFLFSCDFQNKKLRNEAEYIIRKIDLYKKEKGKIPPNLRNIGIEEKEEGPIYYVPMKDSINYIVYFSVGLGESESYYSDTKMWEKVDRGINEQ